jgi:hypothetical protein
MAAGPYGAYHSYLVHETDVRGTRVDAKPHRRLGWQSSSLNFTVSVSSKVYYTSRELGNTLQIGEVVAAGTKFFKVVGVFKEKEAEAVGGGGGGGGGGSAMD